MTLRKKVRVELYIDEYVIWVILLRCYHKGVQKGVLMGNTNLYSHYTLFHYTLVAAMPQCMLPRCRDAGCRTLEYPLNVGHFFI